MDWIAIFKWKFMYFILFQRNLNHRNSNSSLYRSNLAFVQSNFELLWNIFVIKIAILLFQAENDIEKTKYGLMI